MNVDVVYICRREQEVSSMRTELEYINVAIDEGSREKVKLSVLASLHGLPLF